MQMQYSKSKKLNCHQCAIPCSHSQRFPKTYPMEMEVLKLLAQSGQVRHRLHGRNAKQDACRTFRPPMLWRLRHRPSQYKSRCFRACVSKTCHTICAHLSCDALEICCTRPVLSARVESTLLLSMCSQLWHCAGFISTHSICFRLGIMYIFLAMDEVLLIFRKPNMVENTCRDVRNVHGLWWQTMYRIWNCFMARADNQTATSTMFGFRWLWARRHSKSGFGDV